MALRSQIFEEYTDASVELFMAHYAQFLYPGEDADAALIQLPEELDRKCRGLLKKAIRRQRWQQCQKAAFKTLGRVAVVAMVLLSTFTVLFMSVEAIRVPVINFYLTHSKLEYLTISSSPKEEGTFNPDNPLQDMLPGGYTLMQNERSEENHFTAIYQNAEGNYVFIRCEAASRVVQVDTEDAVVQNFRIFNCEAMMVTEENTVRLIFGYEPWNATVVMISNDPQVDVLMIATEFLLNIESA